LIQLKIPISGGSYFDWRPQVIQVIHKANLPIDKKTLQLKKILMTKESTDLATIAETFGKESYYNLIYQLEEQFGGTQRALQFVKMRLLQGEKLKLHDLSSIHSVKARLLNFINHCRDHHLMDQVENTVMQDRVFKALLNEHLLEQLVKDHHIVHFEHALESIEIIVDWLKYRAMLLGYIEQRLEKGIILKSSSSSKQKDLNNAATHKRRQRTA
jgi:hypothetical protein